MTTTTTFSRNNRFNDQNNSSALASRFLVHFFDVHCKTWTWNLLIWRFIEDVDIRRQIFLPLFELENILKNSTPGKVAYIWYVERVQIDEIKFERTKIHFLATFSLPWSSSLLKIPFKKRDIPNTKGAFQSQNWPVGPWQDQIFW